MFDEVPEPVWNTSIGNWSSNSPSATRSAAAAIRAALSSSNRPSSALTRAAAPLIRPSQRTTGTGIRSPETGKFATALVVSPPHSCSCSCTPMFVLSKFRSGRLRLPRHRLKTPPVAPAALGCSPSVTAISTGGSRVGSAGAPPAHPLPAVGPGVGASRRHAGDDRVRATTLRLDLKQLGALSPGSRHLGRLAASLEPPGCVVGHGLVAAGHLEAVLGDQRELDRVQGHRGPIGRGVRSRRGGGGGAGSGSCQADEPPGSPLEWPQQPGQSQQDDRY